MRQCNCGRKIQDKNISGMCVHCYNKARGKKYKAKKKLIPMDPTVNRGKTCYNEYLKEARKNWGYSCYN